jgi:hypothetical protein
VVRIDENSHGLTMDTRRVAALSNVCSQLEHLKQVIVDKCI